MIARALQRILLKNEGFFKIFVSLQSITSQKVLLAITALLQQFFSHRKKK